MKLNVFNGGLHTAPLPQYLNIQDAVELRNVDVQKVALASQKDKKSTNIQVKQNSVYLESKGIWVEFDKPIDYVEYNKNLYVADGVGRPRRYDGNTSYNLGIAAPTVALTPTFDKAPSMPTDYRTVLKEVGLGLGLPVDEVYYFIVKRSVTDGYNSKGIIVHVTRDSVTTIATNVTKPPIYVTSSSGEQDTDLEVRIGNFGTDNTEELIDIYRLYKGAWRYVSTTWGEFYLYDNTYDISSGFEWNPDDGPDISGVVQYVYTFENTNTGAESGPSPLSIELDLTDDGATSVHLANIQSSNDPQVNRINIYRVGNGYAEFMLVAKIDKNPSGLFAGTWFDFGTEPVGDILTTQDIGLPPTGMIAITEAYAMLFGAKGSRLYFTLPGKPDMWPNLYFIDFAFEITMIAPVATGILVSGKLRTDILLGTNPLSFSRQPLNNNQGCIDRKSLQLVGKSAMWVSTDGICQSSGGPIGVITRDRLGKTEFKPKQSAVHDDIYYLLETNRTLFLVDYRKGVIFHKQVVGIDQIMVGADTLYGWNSGKLYELFKGDNLLEFKYISPKFFEGQGTRVKQYKNMYILYEGDIMVKVYVDDIEVQTKELSGKGNAQLKLPQTAQKGNYLQLEITGTGVVHEIYWEPTSGDAG